MLWCEFIGFAVTFYISVVDSSRRIIIVSDRIISISISVCISFIVSIIIEPG